MKYGKTYSTLLSTSTWPQEWRDLAVDYRGLKKLLNGVVEELSAQGLNPVVLNELLDAEKEFENELHGEGGTDAAVAGEHGRDSSPPGRPPSLTRSLSHRSRAQYEFTSDSENITPQLRLWLHSQSGASSPNLSSTHLGDNSNSHSSAHTDVDGSTKDESKESEDREKDGRDGARTVLMSSSVQLAGKANPLYALRNEYEAGERSAWIEEVDDDDDEEHDAASHSSSSPTILINDHLNPHDVHLQPSDDTQELIIPLTADTAFHRLLANTLSSLSALQNRTRTHLSDEILTLADTIASCSGPPSRSRKSDLYAWREIFQLWVECQIYRGGATERERASGEGGIRSVGEAEQRLGMFASEVVKRGLGDRRTLKSARSREALEKFLNLNVHILDLKKFQLANAEAARKILKKHEKRTALPSATSLAVLPISQPGTNDLPQMLITTLTNTLLPILPSLDDYSCLICTSIAFKPIRLACGHLFCVRCLVKMQKRGQGECPLCRTPCVLLANRDNLDMGLMNFMQDWFPKETKEKARANERESAEEELIEMGINPNGCIIS